MGVSGETLESFSGLHFTSRPELWACAVVEEVKCKNSDDEFLLCFLCVVSAWWIALEKALEDGLLGASLSVLGGISSRHLKSRFERRRKMTNGLLGASWVVLERLWAPLGGLLGAT